jgi:hypothetical protein
MKILDMKKIIGIAAVFVAVLGFTSCEQCATCTFNDPDRGQLTEDFCDRGKVYDDTMETYDDAGWDCVED